MTTEFFDSLALWQIFLGTAGLIYLSIEVGIRFGNRHQHAKSQLESSVSTMAGATAGLLAFMLAVTYGAAASRHDTRKQLVVEESNAIGTTYLRASLLAEPSRSQVRQLLRQYVDTRLDAALQGNSNTDLLVKTEAIQKSLWAQAESTGRKNPGSIAVGLFIQSLNQVIDLHLERLTAGVRNRVPWISWAALYLLAALTMFQIGYREGLGNSRSVLTSLALVLAFSTVLFLIADLDRPQQGLIRVSQQAMVDLQNQLRSDK